MKTTAKTIMASGRLIDAMAMRDSTLKVLGLSTGGAIGAFVLPLALAAGESIPAALVIIAFGAGLALELRAVADELPE